MSCEKYSPVGGCAATADLGMARALPSGARPLTLADAVDELLASIHQERCGPEVVQALRNEAEHLLRERTAVAPGRSFQERAYLIESGAFTLEELARSETRITHGELRELENRSALSAIAASYSEAEVASRFGIGIEEVRRRRSNGELFAFDAVRTAVYPTWQFAEATVDGVLPHLARVLKALRSGERNPASVLGFMTMPKRDLAIGKVQLTPVQWLLRGGSPRRLENILEAEWWR